ncbi:hypothetical protein OTU49_001008 [Cherax quadricarinatus]|uniref:Uncharacterized protein n=1 Tax=Cherax quadricarinatus TaxID=27406 RepID=A0AAW0XHW9_CHEQU
MLCVYTTQYPSTFSQLFMGDFRRRAAVLGLASSPVVWWGGKKVTGVSGLVLKQVWWRPHSLEVEPGLAVHPARYTYQVPDAYLHSPKNHHHLQRPKVTLPWRLHTRYSHYHYTPQHYHLLLLLQNFLNSNTSFQHQNCIYSTNISNNPFYTANQRPSPHGTIAYEITPEQGDNTAKYNHFSTACNVTNTSWY